MFFSQKLVNNVIKLVGKAKPLLHPMNLAIMNPFGNLIYCNKIVIHIKLIRTVASSYDFHNFHYYEYIKPQKRGAIKRGRLQ